jgi:hypothetical protein
MEPGGAPPAGACGFPFGTGRRYRGSFLRSTGYGAI